MPRQLNLIKLFSYSTLVVISVLTLLICVVLVFNKYQSFAVESDKIEKKFLYEQLNLVKSRVHEVIDYIDYNRSQTEEILKKNIKARVEEAYAIVANIYKRNKSTRSGTEIKKMVKDALRPLRFNNGRGYYFIDDMDTNIILYPPDPSLEEKRAPGQNALDRFVELVKAKGEGFTYYEWFKPDQRTILNKKATYLKLFRPYRWIIGTGEYLDEVEKDIQQKVIARIENIRFGPGKKYYVFIAVIVDKKGGKQFAKFLANPRFPKSVGQFISDDVQDIQGNYFFKKMVRDSLEAGEAQVTYSMEDATGRIIEKTVYCKLYPGWNWLVGAGFYPAELEKIISRNKQLLRATTQKEILSIIGVFLVILILSVWAAYFFSKKIKREFDIFSNFFKSAAHEYKFLDKKELKVAEFKDLADSANKMIQDRKAGEDALIKAKEMAEAATRLKSEFLANVSHEIRTPMNAVIGMSEILAQTELNEDQSEYLEIINNSAINLLGIINDILDYSKMEAGKILLEEKEFRLRDLVESTTEMVAPEAQEKRLEIACFIDPVIPDSLHGDPTRLQQILLNLANNAVKFTEQGEIFISVEQIDSKNDRLGLIFRVKDTGIGISPAGKNRLFKTFSQIDTTSTRRYEGTGLGLAISRKLTELMGGEIGVESEIEKGSCFWFTAFFDIVPGPEAKDSDYGGPKSLENLKILVVDDHKKNRVTIRRYLESYGAYCVDVAGALEAFSTMQAAAQEDTAFDVVLVDFDLPVISGPQIANMIRDSREIQDTRLILLSSTKVYENNRQIESMGFAAHLHKPIRQSSLLRSVSGVAGIKGSVKKTRTPHNGHEANLERLKNIKNRNLNILLVEDNYFNQKVVIFNLEKYGHTIDVAENGKVGVEKFNNGDYDLVLMDVQMPIMDGYEATKLMRTHDSSIPIIAMTANSSQGDEAESLQAGMDAHISKPFSLEKLIQTLETILKS